MAVAIYQGDTVLLEPAVSATDVADFNPGDTEPSAASRAQQDRSPGSAILLGDRSPGSAILLGDRSPGSAILLGDRSPGSAIVLGDRSPSSAILLGDRAKRVISSGHNVVVTALHVPVDLPVGKSISTGLAEKTGVDKAYSKRTYWTTVGGAAAAVGVLIIALASGPGRSDPPIPIEGASLPASDPPAGAVQRSANVPNLHAIPAPPIPSRPAPSEPAASLPTPPPSVPTPTPAPAVPMTLVSVTIETKPKARVVRNDVEVGMTPLTLTWSAGEEPPAVTLRAPGYEDMMVFLDPDFDGKTQRYEFIKRR